MCNECFKSKEIIDLRMENERLQRCFDAAEHGLNELWGKHIDLEKKVNVLFHIENNYLRERGE